ncbi:phage GP46 family protein [Kluyvera ascorbata]|uniref:phage GP46 family protein n=1 Tax=Kluyvera ascorbata TaxID=51288 RepID=UPI0035CCF78F
MTDIKSSWNADELHADWLETTGALACGDDFWTAVIISLFTDRVARSDDLVEDRDRRGWWGDSTEQNQLGSRLWLIRREKLTRAVALRAEEYASEALKWLVDDGVVLAVEPVAQIVFPNRLNLFIRYLLPQRTDWETLQFYWVWEAQVNAV